MTEALRDKLAADADTARKPWAPLLGRLKHLHHETERINRLIEESSQEIDPEMWR